MKGNIAGLKRTRQERWCSLENQVGGTQENKLILVIITVTMQMTLCLVNINRQNEIDNKII